jgi:tetratricopeptide (TPR) repeat protein
MGGDCQGKPTIDLVLRFPKNEEAWLRTGRWEAGPCQFQALPQNDGGLELRLSYLAKEGQRNISHFVFATAEGLMIDHWFGKRPAKSVQKSAKNGKKAAGGASAGVAPLSNTILDVFEDEASWDKLLGPEGQALSMDTPELDRFRIPNLERNLGVPTVPVERRALNVPLIPLPILDDPLSFATEPFKVERFEALRRESGEHEPTAEVANGVLDGMNYVLRLVSEKNWLAAQQALDVLERGNLRKWLPSADAAWWTLKGYVYVMLGDSLKNDEFRRTGLDLWRAGLQKVAGRGGTSQAYADYMTLETTRRLFEAKNYYAAAGMLTWAMRFRWGPGAEERFAYLNAEAHYRLSLFDDAIRLFQAYVEERRARPLSAQVDRRLLPMAAFRVGDAYFRMNRFKDSVREYTRAMSVIPSLQKAAFEGRWYPEEIRHYPQIFFHRAEASIKLGLESNALADLRAFTHFALTHPQAGLVLFRTGEVLQALGSPVEKVSGAWRECVFRVSNAMGGRLCAARIAASEFRKDQPVQWPRLVATVEDARPAIDDPLFKGTYRDDVIVFLEILLSDAFIRMDQPFQANSRLEPVKSLSPSPYMKMWLDEYRVATLGGLLLKKVDEKNFRDVISTYEKQKRELLFEKNRVEILWPLALSYKGMGLNAEALKTLEVAASVKKSIGPRIERPYDPRPEDWDQLRAELQTKLLEDGKIQASEVEVTLKLLDQKDPRTLRLRARIGAVTKNLSAELQAFSQLAKVDNLSWVEVRRYSRLLSQAKKPAERLLALEGSVGIWFKGKDAASVANGPGPDLLFELFESRSESKKPDSALSVADFLLGLEEKDLGPLVGKDMLSYKKGEILRRLGRIDDARQSFERAKTLAPQGVWGKLAETALTDLTNL